MVALTDCERAQNQKMNKCVINASTEVVNHWVNHSMDICFRMGIIALWKDNKIMAMRLFRVSFFNACGKTPSLIDTRYFCEQIVKTGV